MAATTSRPVALPRTRAAFAAHLADGHRQTRLYGRPTLGESEWEHRRLHPGEGAAAGHVHDWSRWGRGVR